MPLTWAYEWIKSQIAKVNIYAQSIIIACSTITVLYKPNIVVLYSPKRRCNYVRHFNV